MVIGSDLSFHLSLMVGEVSEIKEASISLKRLGDVGDVIVHVIAYNNGISTREHEVKHENEAAHIVRSTQKGNR